MRGNDHVALSMATALFCISPFVTADITAERFLCCVCFLAGICFGSHLPDMDVAAAEGLTLKSFRGLIISVVSIIIVSVAGVVYWAAGSRFDSRHRHSLHTVWGVSIATVVIGAVTCILFEYAGWWSYNLLYVYAGIFCGGLLHLAEDCCTISGLQPFLPVSSLQFRGGINTGNYHDHRPARYAKCLVFLASAVISLQYMYHIPAGRLLLPVLASAAGLWVLFYFLSQHRCAQRR